MVGKLSWKQRQAEHRKAAILEVLHRPSNESEVKAISRIARKFNGRNLPGGKNLRLSPSTLKRLWYAWKADPSDKVFDLHYAEGQREPLPLWQIRLMESFAIQNGYSVHELHRHLKAADPEFPPSKDSFYRHLPADTKKRITCAAQLHRRRTTIDEKMKTLTGGKR